MPKVTTVMSILKSRASASCHSAVYRLGPAGRSAKLLAMPVFVMLAGCGAEGGETETSDAADLESNLKKRLPTADLLVAAELRRVEQRAVVKELRDQLGAAHPGVAVREGHDSGHRRHRQHLDDGVAAQPSGLAFAGGREARLTAVVEGERLPSLYLRILHQAMLALMNSAPQRPPNIPRKMKGTSSTRCHGVWNST